MSGRTAGRYGGVGGGGSSSGGMENPGSGATHPSRDDEDIERRRANRYDRRRSRSGSAERRRRVGGGVGGVGERYARTEAPGHYPPHPLQQQQDYPNPYMQPQPQLQQHYPMAQGGMYGMPHPQSMMAAPFGGGGGGGGGGGMNSDQLFHFLQGAGPTPALGHVQHAQSQPQPLPTPEDPRSAQSVQDFIPTVPKSLLNLLRGTEANGGHAAAASTSVTTGPESGIAGAPDASAGAHAAATTAVAANALALLEAPKIAPEVLRRARETRRAHISGFPASTTEEELHDFFRLLMPDIRRVKTQREVRELGLAAGDGEDDVRQIPGNAQVEVDHVRNVQMRQAKSKAFAFIEVNMADLITEMVDESAKDPERFIFYPATRYGGEGGRGYPITIRRPKDFEPLDGYDEGRVVMTGFHHSLPADKLRAAMEQFGPLDKFDVRNGLAYAEFTNAKDAIDCRTDLHGEVLGQKMVVVLPLYYWLICVCHTEGIDVTVREDDPISGKFALTHDLFGPNGVLTTRHRESEALLSAPAAGGAARGGGGEGSAGAGAAVGPGALVAASGAADAMDPMKDLLGMSLRLPEVIHRLGLLYPHLRPLYGNAQAPIYATRVLALLNLFDEEELVLDVTYSRLLADIEEEVEKYGRVEDLIVPRRQGRPRAPDAPKKEDFEEHENPTEAFAQAQADYQLTKKAFNEALDKFFDRQIHPIYGGFGRVFVVYETVDEAAEAQRHIAGKLFGNRTVVTSFVFEDLLKEVEEEEEESRAGDDGEKKAEAEADEAADEGKGTSAEGQPDADRAGTDEGHGVAETAETRVEEEEGGGEKLGAVEDLD